MRPFRAPYFLEETLETLLVDFVLIIFWHAKQRPTESLLLNKFFSAEIEE